MEIVIYCIALIVLYYCLHIGLLIYGLTRVPSYTYSITNNLNKFSIVIPFKNEANNLEDLLHSIANLNFDKLNFEIILVNDASTDSSTSIVNNWRFKNPYVQLTILDNVVVSNSSKKDAISRAIHIAKFDWIITTDADCILPENFLQCYSSFITNFPDKQFLIGGVFIANKSNFLVQYQVLDIATLQAVTRASYGIDEPFMCNGANLAFTKKIFKEVKGYSDVNHIASGDDVFLLQKVLEYNKDVIAYILNEDCIVETKPVNSWLSLISQRARWGGKSVAYKALYPKILGVFTILTNLSFFVLSFCLIYHHYVFICFGIILVKFIFDLILLILFSKNYKKIPLIYFPVAFVIYPIIIFLTLLRLVSTKNNWKK